MKYWATLVTTLLILMAVLIPGSTIPDVKVIGFDKAVHFCMFFTWAIAVRFDFLTASKKIIIISGIVFSLSTELLQFVAEDRSFDVYDLVADTVGLIVGILAAPLVINYLINHFFKRNS